MLNLNLSSSSSSVCWCTCDDMHLGGTDTWETIGLTSGWPGSSLSHVSIHVGGQRQVCLKDSVWGVPGVCVNREIVLLYFYSAYCYFTVIYCIFHFVLYITLQRHWLNLAWILEWLERYMVSRLILCLCISVTLLRASQKMHDCAVCTLASMQQYERVWYSPPPVIPQHTQGVLCIPSVPLGWVSEWGADLGKDGALFTRWWDPRQQTESRGLGLSSDPTRAYVVKSIIRPRMGWQVGGCWRGPAPNCASNQWSNVCMRFRVTLKHTKHMVKCLC